MKQTILVMGLGKVGMLVAEMLDEYLPQFNVIGVDLPWSKGLEFWMKQGKLGMGVNVADIGRRNDQWGILFANMKDPGVNCWGVVSCLPYYLNLKVAEAANSFGVNYFDLTEDVNTTKAIMKLPNNNINIRVPQCGLAPGFIGMLGAYLVETDPRLNELSLMVGALPKNPQGDLGYACNWSPEGLVNEYLNDAEVLEEFEPVTVPALHHKTNVIVQGVDLEAFSTSGGLGTMCLTFKGKLRNLAYRTLRYPGHIDMIRFLVHELGLANRPELLQELLVKACPPDPDDLVFVKAYSTNFYGADTPQFKTYARIFTPKELFGVTRTAIAWTTAAGVCGVVELAAQGALKPGFVNVELIPLPAFARTHSGKLFELEELLNERETA